MTIMACAQMRRRLFKVLGRTKCKGQVAWENNLVTSKPMGHLCIIGLLRLPLCIIFHKRLEIRRQECNHRGSPFLPLCMCRTGPETKVQR